MRPLDWNYELHVVGARPKTLSLQDFGELVKRFADLLGSTGSVHFGALRPGSARILAKVEEPARPEVRLQLVEAKAKGSGSAKVVRLDEYLSSRGWHGEVRTPDGAVVLTFPGASTAKPAEEVRTVQQMDSLVGKVIRIGGRDETVPMTVETVDGSFVDVTVRGRDMARGLAQHLFGADVRISGLATWQRDTEGQWSCIGLNVSEFEVLDATSAVDFFRRLEGLEGNGWNELEDPQAVWQKLRGDN